MLVLSRDIGKAIIINDDIMVVILGVKGRQVKLGIEAPKDVSVHREEIYNKIKQQEHNKEQISTTIPYLNDMEGE